MPVQERALTLRKSELPDWYVIEWAEHEHKSHMEQIGDRAFAFRWSGRVSDADVEGTAEEMRAIATAIENGGNESFRRCAVRRVGDEVRLWSPRNSVHPGVVSVAQATHLAAEIRRVLGD